MILYLASDLLWATRIKSCADDLSPPVPARPVRTLSMLEARLADSPVRGVLLDLAAGEEGGEGPEGGLALAMLARLRGGGSAPDRGPGAGAGHGTGLTRPSTGIRVVVFGPHVLAQQLAAARAAGADAVMSRGAVSENLPRVLRELNGEAPGRA